MGENSGIEWTDHTFNPWWGCAKISPACDLCYAQKLAHRVAPGVDYWTVDGARREFGDKHWNEPIRWNARAYIDEETPRVFCASMADVFDKNAPAGARDRLWKLIAATPSLRWLLLTKRIGNARAMLPPGPPMPNAAIGITVVTQAEVERDVSKLLQIAAPMRFLSVEPMLGPINLTPYFTWSGSRYAGTIDWVIAGGESGPGARPVAVTWLRSLRDQCDRAGVPFFFKQWGEWAPPDVVAPFADLNWNGTKRAWPHDYLEGEYIVRARKKQTGRTLDGQIHSGIPSWRATSHAKETIEF